MSAEALSKYGPRIIPEMVEAIKTKNNNAPYAVLGTLSYMYAGGTLPDRLDSVTPVLKALLEDENIHILINTSNLISKLGPDAKETVPALIKNLSHSNREVRIEAIDALIHIGPVGIPDLAKALTHDQSNTRMGSLAVLCEFESLPDSLIAPLANMLNDEAPHVRRIAILTLGNIQPKNSQIIEILKKAINDSDKNVGLFAHKTLSKILDEDNSIRGQNPWRI